MTFKLKNLVNTNFVPLMSSKTTKDPQSDEILGSDFLSMATGRLKERVSSKVTVKGKSRYTGYFLSLSLKDGISDGIGEVGTKMYSPATLA